MTVTNSSSTKRILQVEKKAFTFEPVQILQPLHDAILVEAIQGAYASLLIPKEHAAALATFLASVMDKDPASEAIVCTLENFTVHAYIKENSYGKFIRLNVPESRGPSIVLPSKGLDMFSATLSSVLEEENLWESPRKLAGYIQSKKRAPRRQQHSLTTTPAGTPAGYPHGREVPIAKAEIVVERKHLTITVAHNDRGRFLRIVEVSGNRSQVLIPESAWGLLTQSLASLDQTLDALGASHGSNEFGHGQPQSGSNDATPTADASLNLLTGGMGLNDHGYLPSVGLGVHESAITGMEGVQLDYTASAFPSYPHDSR